MEAFVIIGGVGVAIVVLSLFIGDFLDGVLDFEHFGVGDGLLSTPVVGAFLAAFGAGGALLLRGLQFSVAGSLLGALAAGVILGGVTLVLVRSLMDMPTDATPRSADLVGSMGTVVTRIPEGGMGEISLVASGQRMKLNARAKGPIDSGRPIIVVDVTSPTSVVVTESEFQDY